MTSTDPQDELFPVVNDRDEVIGKITRKEANSNPNIIHRAAGVFVFNDRGELLIQTRSETKDTFPGCLDISVGGHVDYGDDYLTTAVRETSEELGLEIDKTDLKLLGKLLVKLPCENEFWELYKYQLPGDYHFQSNDEVTSAQFMSLASIKQSLADPHEKWSDKARQQIQGLILK